VFPCVVFSKKKKKKKNNRSWIKEMPITGVCVEGKKMNWMQPVVDLPGKHARMSQRHSDELEYLRETF